MELDEDEYKATREFYEKKRERDEEKKKMIYGAMLLEELNRKFIEREFGNNKGE